MVLVLTLIGVGILFVTANYGGRLVFEHAAAIPTPVLQEELHERSEGHHHHGGRGGDRPTHDPPTPLELPGSGATWTPPGTPPHTHSHPIPALRRTRTTVRASFSRWLDRAAACQPNTGRPVFSPASGGCRHRSSSHAG